MARPKEFDVDNVISAATEAFWTGGYEGTSMQDLMQATGLHKGSIYNSFGDKHELFVSCITRYLEQGYQRVAEAIASESTARKGLIKAMYAIQSVTRGKNNRGCFGMKTVAELVPGDAAVTNLVNNHFARVAKLISTTIARGQEDGELRDDVDPVEVTKFLMTVNAGLLTGSKSFLDATDADSVIEMVFKCLD